MTNPILLTLAAILLTITGQAPLDIWTPLIEELVRMFTSSIM